MSISVHAYSYSYSYSYFIIFIFIYIYIYIYVCSYLHIHSCSHAHSHADIEMFADSPTEATMTDRCRAIEKKRIFHKFYVLPSALEACLCKGIAFGMHPSKLHKQVATAKALCEQNY